MFCIVFLFTSLLFLSGYVLQQQTVQNIQAALRAPSSVPHPPTDSSRALAESFDNPSEHLYFEKFLAEYRPRGGWGKVAYVQPVRDHLHVCNAVMLFATLEKQESLARRVILYPKEWRLSESTGGTRSIHVETSFRLLQNAEKRYNVELQAVSRMPVSRNGRGGRSENTYANNC